MKIFELIRLKPVSLASSFSNGPDKDDIAPKRGKPGRPRKVDKDKEKTSAIKAIKKASKDGRGQILDIEV